MTYKIQNQKLSHHVIELFTLEETVPQKKICNCSQNLCHEDCLSWLKFGLLSINREEDTFKISSKDSLQKQLLLENKCLPKIEANIFMVILSSMLDSKLSVMSSYTKHNRKVWKDRIKSRSKMKMYFQTCQRSQRDQNLANLYKKPEKDSDTDTSIPLMIRQFQR